MSTTPNNTTSTSFSQVPIATALKSSPAPKRWTREEYHRLADLGWFRDERVELINGEIIKLTPQTSEHSYVIGKLNRLLAEVFSEEYWVRTQLPLRKGDFGEPEPDVSVVHGSLEQFVDDHPDTATLVIEVSLSSLDYDKRKAHVYASMGVPDYWVLDLENRQLLVHRGPIEDSQQPLGHRYSQIETIAADGHIAPLEKPEAKLAAAEMLPPNKQLPL